MIPGTRFHGVTLTAQTAKSVTCESCGTDYVYLFGATAHGEGTSLGILGDQGGAERAHDEAETQLQALLADGCSVVPCPACGWVQRQMFPEARRWRHRWMRHVAVGLLAVAGLVAVVAFFGTLVSFSGEDLLGAAWWWLGAAILAATAGGVAWLRSSLANRYDPNSEPVEQRKLHGRWLATTKEELAEHSGNQP